MTSTNIFVSDDGKPLLIFLDPKLSKAREELVRTLTNGGADLQPAFDDAEIILAQESSQQVASHHRQKVVLDIDWVRASVSRGHCFTEREGWGNHRILPDQNEPQGPQATTKQATPLPPAPPVSIPQMFNGGVSGQMPVQMPVGAPQPSGPAPAMPFGSQWIPFFQQPGGNAYQHLPAPQAPPPNQYPSQAQPSVPMTVATPLSLLNSPPIAIPVLLQQAILDHLAALAPDNAYTAQLFSLLVVYTQQQQQQQQLMLSHVKPADTPNLQPTASASASSAPPSRHESSSRLSTSEHRPQTPSSSHRQERARSPPPSRPSTKKHAASSSASAPLKRKSQDEVSVDRTKQRRVSHAEIETNSVRATLKSKKREVAKPTKPASRSRHGLFVDEHDKPVPFFVQSGNKWRNEAIGAIRKNGGAIVADISDATYVILWPNVDHSYERLREALIYGKMAVRSTWVHDSARDGELKDPSEERYTLDGHRLRDRHNRQIVVKLAALARDVEKDREKVAKMKLRKALHIDTEPAARTSTAARPQEQEADDDEEEEREVRDAVDRVSENAAADDPDVPEPAGSPSPPTVAVPMNSVGRNRYTDDELEYCYKYCKRLLSDNFDLSSTELSNKLAEKMPQHSAASWCYKLGHLRPRIEDEIRREAAIRRKEEKSKDKDVASQPQPATNTQPAGAPPPSPTVKPSKSPPPPLPPHYQEDLATVLNFLATYADDGKNEDAVWQQMSTQHTCRSASSWHEFWLKFHSDIEAEIEKQAAVGQSTSSS